MDAANLTDTIRARVSRLSPEQRAALVAAASPRLVRPYIPGDPWPPQAVFLGLDVTEAFFGGSAGPGKTEALLMGALQYVDVPGYNALIVRRTWPDLDAPDSVLSRARDWLVNTPARKKAGGRLWVFPSGAKVQFGHIQYDADKLKFGSAQYQYIGMDEVTHWEHEQTYTFLFSRLRKATAPCLRCLQPLDKVGRGDDVTTWQHQDDEAEAECPELQPDWNFIARYPPASDGTTLFDVPIRMRSAANPIGPGVEWVSQRFVDAATRYPGAVFIPARLADNPAVNRKQYLSALSHLSEIDQARLIDGDWSVREHGGLFWRADFIPIEKPLPCDYWCRFWDLASSKEKGADFTVGALCGLTPDRQFVIADIVRGQWNTFETEQMITRTAALDGTVVDIAMEQEPGSSGKSMIDHYRRALAGYYFHGVPSTGSKVTRAKPLSSYVKGGHVSMVLAPWNRDFLNELDSFPEGPHDDITDAVAGAFNHLYRPTVSVS
jgi:predicted phage terminase large subunit-like protein